jgi:hypothetical protein
VNTTTMTMTPPTSSSSSATNFLLGSTGMTSRNRGSEQQKKVRCSGHLLISSWLTHSVFADILKAITEAPKLEQPLNEEIREILKQVCILFFLEHFTNLLLQRKSKCNRKAAMQPSFIIYYYTCHVLFPRDG